MSFDPKNAETTLFAALLDAARAQGAKRVIIEDAERASLTYGRLVLGSLVLGRKLVAGTRPGEAIGLLLPNANAMALAILGVNAFGRVSALLNFTAGERNLTSAIKTAPARVVVTSRRFIEMAKLEETIAHLAKVEVAPGKTVRVVYLEDVRKTIGTADKLAGVLRGSFARTMHRRTGGKPGDPAVILFTSGTEGKPKGVVLTNRNVVANAQQMFAHADGMFTPADFIMNPLPMFHSFGLTVGTLMPLLTGMKVMLYPSPLHYKQITKLIGETKATVLFSTDTFLQGYARAAEPGDLDCLRLVIAGAERLKPQTRDLWAKYPAQLLEGYGVTETAPVVACNLPQAGRIGTVGRLLPGVETRLTPVEGITEGGRLLVRGVNVMAGYLMADKPGVVSPPEGGWHDTGDIVTLEDGYLSIRGRAKRFAKISGEMVSLAAVEQLVASLWPDAQSVVVTVPDARKGEQLVLVTTETGAAKEQLLAHAREQGFADLWVPKAIVTVAQIPVSGSGKVDLAATAEVARNARVIT